LSEIIGDGVNMVSVNIFQGIINRINRRARNEHKKYCCPVCGIGSDDSQEIFHHIIQEHVMCEKPAQVLNVSNDADDELQKIYTKLVRTYKTSDRIIIAIADLQGVSMSEKVLLGYVLGRNASLKGLLTGHELLFPGK
jgi:hypothetical protein